MVKEMIDKNVLDQWSKEYRFFTSDSRLMNKDGIFVALKGEQQDGHNFVEGLLKKPGGAFVVSEDFKNSHEKLTQDVRVLVCPNPHEVHRYLASNFRKKFRGPVVGVGGSSGKTSTKDFLAQILASHFRVFKTQKSQNGELGIPKTLEGLNDNFDVAVIEIGIDAPGDMKRHVELVAPTNALLTSIGEEHLNLLKTIDCVFEEEKLLFEDTWSRGGMCFAPAGDVYLSQLQSKYLKLCPVKTELLDESFETTLDHPYLIQNAALAASCALYLGVPKEKVAQELKKLAIPSGRGGVYWKNENTAIIEDYYNSNPSSLSAAITNAQVVAKKKNLPLTFVLGDMLDLGKETEELHLKKLQEISLIKSEVYLVGTEMSRAARQIKNLAVKKFFEHAKEAEVFFSTNKIENAVVLVKGSRGIGLEGVFKILKDL